MRVNPAGSGTVPGCSPTLDDLVIRIPWFSRTQWTALDRKTDGAVFGGRTYAQWRKETKASMASIHRAGIRTSRVDVQAGRFALWCRTMDKPMTGASLADYMAAGPDG
ncbi:hypothetical protein [Desulfoplanes sp.]